MCVVGVGGRGVGFLMVLTYLHSAHISEWDDVGVIQGLCVRITTSCSKE